MTNKKVQVIRGSKSSAEDVLRVAAYCRVSTDSEDQVNSFIAQMHYYYSFIKQSENMVLVDVYADEGITGTSVTKRDDFNRMIKDCKNGKIDRIYMPVMTTQSSRCRRYYSSNCRKRRLSRVDTQTLIYTKFTPFGREVV